MYSKEQCELLVNGALANNALIIQAAASECTALSWLPLCKRTIQGKITVDILNRVIGERKGKSTRFT